MNAARLVHDQAISIGVDPRRTFGPQNADELEPLFELFTESFRPRVFTEPIWHASPCGPSSGIASSPFARNCLMPDLAYLYQIHANAWVGYAAAGWLARRDHQRDIPHNSPQVGGILIQSGRVSSCRHDKLAQGCIEDASQLKADAALTRRRDAARGTAATGCEANTLRVTIRAKTSILSSVSACL